MRMSPSMYCNVFLEHNSNNIQIVDSRSCWKAKRQDVAGYRGNGHRGL